MSPKRVLPRRVRSFFSFSNIRLELNSPSGASAQRKKRERKEGGVGGRKERRTQDRSEKREEDEKEMGWGRGGCRVCIALLCSVLTLESEFYFIKHTRGALFHLVCLTSAESIHSLISRATHENTHKEAVRFKLFCFRKNAVLILKW